MVTVDTRRLRGNARVAERLGDPAAVVHVAHARCSPRGRRHFETERGNAVCNITHSVNKPKRQHKFCGLNTSSKAPFAELFFNKNSTKYTL